MDAASGPQSWLKRATPWSEPQPLTQKSLAPVLGAVLAETLLYGVHLILFLICVYFLVARKMRLQWLMLSGVIAMFLLATADIGFSFHTILKQTQSIVFPKFVIYVTNNSIALLLLVARFYVVWGQKKWMLALALIPALASTGFGYACRIENPQTMKRLIPAYFLINLITSNILTFLTGTSLPFLQLRAAASCERALRFTTAGRIWWISRSASDVLGKRRRQYRITSAIIVESGLLYSVSMLLVIALSSTVWVSVAAAVMLRMVSIVPVLMVVQIAINHASSTSRRERGKTADIPALTTRSRVPTSAMLDTIVRTDLPTDSSIELTSRASTTAPKFEPQRNHVSR
ncbi:hypothetical protein CC1G_09802 [Coprinopsis cinerea okayama7|uniref:Integral membrane protein n=1 Tax=Coprinopsis cinerea (strain Okayama-7 / 130 / ATCC MYA-4618 / FGSC 9003) TaxID=240176 RepID=A8NMA2_COPC7|nr:hypothetical protein CC1G_09802 [Coprinopsis cinerea okayama7\|eukprot:XP_001834875.2 hypothetical protein CC1G_09802 [Coprinopsis cinerea okayama7\